MKFDIHNYFQVTHNYVSLSDAGFRVTHTTDEVTVNITLPNKQTFYFLSSFCKVLAIIYKDMLAFFLYHRNIT